MDYLSKARRSEVMANVKGKNTSLEKAMFALLRHENVKFWRHVKALPGKPDIVFPSQKIAIFVDGDFWHGYKYSVWGHKLQPYWEEIALIFWNYDAGAGRFSEFGDMTLRRCAMALLFDEKYCGKFKVFAGQSYRWQSHSGGWKSPYLWESDWFF